MTTENWEQVAKRLEEIDVAALADDEKATLRTALFGMRLFVQSEEIKKAVRAGECSGKLANRIARALDRLRKQMLIA